jgi:hypothetical protein
MEVTTGLFEEKWPYTAEMSAAREVQQAAAIAEYIEGRKNISDEQRAEEAFERRAAFGPDVEVVDIITGEVTRT